MGRVAIAKRIAHASHKKMVSRQPKLSLEKPVAASKPEREIIPRTVDKNIGGCSATSFTLNFISDCRLDHGAGADGRITKPSILASPLAESLAQNTEHGVRHNC